MVLREPRDPWKPEDRKPQTTFKFLIPRSYYYHDTPDGQDLVKKLWFCANTIGKAGVVHGTVMAMLGYPKIETFGEGCVRVLHYTKLYLAVPTIFTTAAHFLTIWREKDNELNYTIAGFLAGTYHGYWKGSVQHGIYVGLFYSLLGFAYKFNIMRDYSHTGYLIPLNTKVQTVNSLQKGDFTYTPEYPRNWYRAEEVQEKKLSLPTGTPVFLTR